MKLKQKIIEEFKEIEGSIDYDGNGTDLLKELRREENDSKH